MGYEIDFLPVGDGEKSGDAITLRWGNLSGPRNEQIVVVIDGGFSNSGETVVNHIRSYYQTDLVDLVVSTHPDTDHTAGLQTVLEQLKVGTLWMHLPWNHTREIADMFRDGRVTDMSIRESIRESLEAACALEKLARSKGIPVVEPFVGLADKTGRVIVVGPTEDYYVGLLPNFRGTPEPKQASLAEKALFGIKEAIRILAERFDWETLDDSGETSAENNSSTILLVNPGDTYWLLTGDAGIPALTEAVNCLDAAAFDFSKVNFIQVPHHGSQRNIGPTLLNKLIGPKLQQEQKIKTAFVSCSKEGAPKHPAKKVTNAFRRRGAHVHATQGWTKRHYINAPDRSGWEISTALPFYYEVEE
jgi:beta-lactamase superfamily II metal-dependent hydrolase